LKKGRFKLHIEAKQAWVKLGCSPQANKLRIGRKLERAWRDAGEIQHEQSEYRAGVLFAVPSVRHEHALDTKQRFDDWIADLRTLENLAALAAIFDPNDPHPEGEWARWPGVALLIRLRE
jgi:hypothetical protein